MSELKVSILPNYYLNNDGTFNRDDAINLCGKIAGVCYDKEGFNHLKDESLDKTLKRVDRTINNGHHSVYDHIFINFNIENIPKILAMILNNEKQYTTSEKSFRYTPIIRGENSIITEKEEELYNKWNKILFDLIKKEHGDRLTDIQIKKLAQENSRYFVTVFVPAQMIYTTSLRQINYIASWMNRFINDAKSEFELNVAKYLVEFLSELKRLNVLDERLMKNEKNRSLSLFGADLLNKKEYFDEIYATNYRLSFAGLAQAQRHRTINYKMELKDEDYFVPPILNNDKLINEWIDDMKSVKDVYPMGRLVNVYENGTYDNFILKCKERLCSAAQLEIMLSTKNILDKYVENLDNEELELDIKKYTKGARCTFPCYNCTEDCKYKEGKLLKRNI